MVPSSCHADSWWWSRDDGGSDLPPAGHTESEDAACQRGEIVVVPDESSREHQQHDRHPSWSFKSVQRSDGCAKRNGPKDGYSVYLVRVVQEHDNQGPRRFDFRRNLPR